MSTQMLPMSSPRPQTKLNNPPPAPTRYLRFGAFLLDVKREELFKDGARVKLQGKVYQALLALLEKPGDILTREALRTRLWPADTHVNYDANVNTTVNKLRQVLGDSPEEPIFVDTIPRKGYSFIAKVEYLDRLAALPEVPPAKLPSVSSAKDLTGPKSSFLRLALSSKWFTVGVLTLLVASVLFGAALMLYAHRGI
jgi:DNA-binding winged helix-turn-helix (wHTH) protein